MRHTSIRRCWTESFPGTEQLGDPKTKPCCQGRLRGMCHWWATWQETRHCLGQKVRRWRVTREKWQGKRFEPKENDWFRQRLKHVAWSSLSLWKRILEKWQYEKRKRFTEGEREREREWSIKETHMNEGSIKKEKTHSRTEVTHDDRRHGCST